MYNVKDNAEAKLQVWLSSLATTLVVELGNGMLFPDAPFIAVLNKRDSDWKITKSEKVEVTAKDGDQYTVNRGYEWTTPLDFNAWDFFSLFVLARHIQDLQEWLEISANDTAIANEYSSSSTYSVWAIVMYKWDRYRCTTAVSTAENFNPNKWTKVSVQSNISTIEGNVSWLQTNMNNILTNWIPTQVLTKKYIIWEAFTKWVHLWYIPKNDEDLATDPAELTGSNTLTTYAYASWTSSNQISFYISKSDTWTTVTDVRVTIWSLTWTVPFNDIQLDRWKVTVTLSWNITSSRWTLLTIQFSLTTTSADWTIYIYQNSDYYYPSWTTEIYVMANDVGLTSYDGDSLYAHCDYLDSRKAKITWSSSRSPSTAYSNDWTNRTGWSAWTARYWRLCRYTRNYSASDIKFRFARYKRIAVWSNAIEKDVVYKMDTGYMSYGDESIWNEWTVSGASYTSAQRLYTTTYTPTVSWTYYLNNNWIIYPSFSDVVSMNGEKWRYLEANTSYTIYVNCCCWAWASWNYSYSKFNINRRVISMWDMPLYPMANKSSWELEFWIYWIVWYTWNPGFIHDHLGDKYWTIKIKSIFWDFASWGWNTVDDVMLAIRNASNIANSVRYSTAVYCSANSNI